jgi:hypothetical protein
MAGPQVREHRNAGYTTALLDFLQIIAKHALPAPRHGEPLLLSLSDIGTLVEFGLKHVLINILNRQVSFRSNLESVSP